MPETCTVEVKLLDADNHEPVIYMLKPKLSAMRALNRFQGGFSGMFRALQSYDADAMAYVIVAGTGAVGNPAKIIEERVYATGVDDLLKPLVRFVNVCANGGRDPDLKASDKGEGSSGND